MASPAPSFSRLANIWRLLALRSDIDSIILELLGAFSLEKIYSEGDRRGYQQTFTNLLAQLTAIFHLQRLTLPTENLHIGWYLGFIVSWEVTLRSIDFVLQTVVDGREGLWDAKSLRDKYLAEFLLSALRVLTLHPKVPPNQRAKDRRDRFSRIHKSLERVFDSYPDKNSFLLLVCKEVTDSLRSDPDSLSLPPGLKYELPNLASELYPLADCLKSSQISALLPPDGFPGNWLSQFLALRDVSQFVVAASVQYVVNQENRNMHLQASSARSRNALIQALDKIRLPANLSKIDLISTFTETFRIILPDTPRLVRQESSEFQIDESEMDAIDALCSRLNNRQVMHRVSDREMMHGVSEVIRDLSLLDDPGGQFRNSLPTRLYVFNCEKCHLAGDSQLRNLGLDLPSDVGQNPEIPLPPKSKCTTCEETVTMVRELSSVRHTWETLKPLQPNPDTINVERHLSSLFELNPKSEGFLIPTYSNNPSASHLVSPATERPQSLSQSLVSPLSPTYRHISDTPRLDLIDSGNTKEVVLEVPSRRTDAPYSPDVVGTFSSNQTYLEPATPALSFESMSPVRSHTMPTTGTLERGKSKWRRFGSRKESTGAAGTSGGDTSSLSSTALESQRLEEISLKTLINTDKKNVQR